MTLTLTYPDGKPNFTRAYMWGFITGSFIDTVTLSGQNLQLYNTSLDLLYNLHVASRFLAPSSNVYSLDFVFELASSYATIHGVQIDTGAQILLDYDPVTFSNMIRIFDGFPPLHTRVTPLPHLAGYWRNV
jgi:hypothetical protein